MASNSSGGYAALRSAGGGGNTKAAKSGGYGALQGYKTPKAPAAQTIPNLPAPGGSTATSQPNKPGPSLFSKAGHVLGAIGSALTSGEQTVSKAVARELPGGTNDLKAAQAQAESATQNIKQIQSLQKQGKISQPAASKIINANAQSASDAATTVKNTEKAMPTTKQLVGGLASTASDIITGGGGALLKEVKAGSVIRKIPELSPGLSKLQKAIVATGAAVSGGGSAVASGATGKQAGISAAAGAALPVFGYALTKAFQRGSKAALAELKATRENVGKGVGAIAGNASTETSKIPEQKLLSAPAVTNDSSATVGAVAGTPHTVPVSDSEYTQRFNSLSNSYDKATKDAAKITSPLKQQAVMESVHNDHLAQLEQLNHEFINGKANPDFVPATPGKQVPTGFTMGAPAPAKAAGAADRQALHIQLSGIDKQVADIRANGLGNKSVQDARDLMAKRQGIVDQLNGKAPVPAKATATAEVKPLPFEGEKPAAPAASGFGQAVPRNAAEVTTPEHIANVTPSIVAQAPKVAKGDTNGAVLNRQMVMGAYNRLIKPVKDAAKGMSQHDVGLIDKIEGNFSNAKEAADHLEAIAGKADNPKQFRNVVNLMRGGYNIRYAGDIGLGRDVGLRHNYLQHMFDRTDTKTNDVLTQLEQEKTHMINNALPGYTKARTIESYDKAGQLGLKRANANSLEDYYKAMANAGSEHGSAVLRQGLEEAHPGQIQVGKMGRGADGEIYHQLKIAGGEALSAPKELAGKINGRAVPEYAQGVVGKTGKVYDKTNAVVKYAKLGGGFFHAFTTAGSTAGQQLLSGHTYAHPLQTLGDNLKLIRSTVSRGAHDKSWQSLAGNGASHSDGLSTLDRMTAAGATTRPEQILADANVFTKSQHSRLNPIAQVHDLVFQRQIPEAKAMLFEQATHKLDINKPADLAQMRRVASQVNNLGGINRAVNGLTPKSAKWLSRVVLATDFTEGKFRTLGSALNLTRWDKGARMARQMVVGKTLLFTLPGLVAAVHSGQLDPTDPKAVEAELTHQILDPSIAMGTMGKPTKSNPGGTPQEAKLPKTFISELASIIQPALSSTSTDRTKGAKDYASARLAALPALGEELKTNTDYYGNPIYGQDKQGNPISGGHTALNIGSLVAPIPANQVGKSLSGSQNAETAALNVAGFKVGNNPTTAQAQHTGAVTDFYNTYNKQYSDRTKVAKQVTKLVMDGNVNQAKRVATGWNNQIAQRITPFRTKYATNYNPAWDTEFQKLVIPTSGRAFTSRLKAGQQAAAILQ